MKLSEVVERKFVESFDVSEWEVESHSGFVPIKASHKTIEYEVYRVTLEDGKEILCADTHILINDSFDEVFAINSIGQNIIVRDGVSKVVSIENLGYSEHMYDLEVDSEDHTYFTNDILSHNTQVTAAYILHFSLYKAAKYIAIVAQLTGQAAEILERVQLSYEQLPLFLQPGVKSYNKRSMYLSNKSKIGCFSSTSTSLRGKSCALVYIDEAAFLKNDMKFYESTYPTIASGKESQVIITSTPNGMRGLFYKLWSEAVDGLNAFVTMRVDWKMVPGRNAKWKRETIANTSEEQFRQEQELAFRGSENSLISGSILETLVKKRAIEARDDGLKIFIEPETSHEYVLFVDTSRGLGLDYHAFSVVDITTNPHEVVATFRNNKLPTLVYPTYIANVATKYNNAHILCELNDLGEQVANYLWNDLEYENMLTVVSDSGKQTIGFNGEKKKLGVKTVASVKSVGCANAKTFIEKKKINLNDEVLIDEFGTMVPSGSSFAADKGANDDLAITIVLYSWAMVQPYFSELINQDARVSLLEQMRKEREEEVVPFGIIDSAEFGEFTGGVNDFQIYSF